MTTRRSARVRGRDEVDANGTTQQEELPAQTAKRARSRKAAPDDASYTTAKPAAQANSDQWLNKTLPIDKRIQWDAILKTHYNLETPHDMYDLFELAVHLAPDEPQEAFVATTGIRLTGPFDLLASGRNGAGNTLHYTMPLYLHGRYFLDPPEVVTVAVDTASVAGAHWCSYRDAPSQPPMYVAYATDASVCSFEPVALSVFDVVLGRLKERTSKSGGEAAVVSRQLQLVSNYVERDGASKAPAAVQSQRKKETLAASLHGLGIVVPYDQKKRTGYRELPVAGDALRNLLANAASEDATARKKVTNLITRANIANDECDFGTSLLLGLDLFTMGVAFQKQSLQILRVAYMLLGRKEFAKVASDHIKHRTPGSQALNCVTSGGTAAAASMVLELPK